MHRAVLLLAQLATLEEADRAHKQRAQKRAEDQVGHFGRHHVLDALRQRQQRRRVGRGGCTHVRLMLQQALALRPLALGLFARDGLLLACLLLGALEPLALGLLPRGMLLGLALEPLALCLVTSQPLALRPFALLVRPLALRLLPRRLLLGVALELVAFCLLPRRLLLGVALELVALLLTRLGLLLDAALALVAIYLFAILVLVHFVRSGRILGQLQVLQV